MFTFLNNHMVVQKNIQQIRRDNIENITKTLFQISLYLLELLSISLLITYFTSFLDPISSKIIFLERFMLSYAIYQILVIVILTNLNDIQKDSFLAWCTTLKLALLYRETNNLQVKKNLEKNLQHQLDISTFNTSVFKRAYTDLNQNLENLDVDIIKLELIKAEQQFELQSLNWKFSFFLRSRFIK